MIQDTVSRPAGQRIPWQKIPGEPESQHKEKQEHSAHPGQFPRFAVRLHKKHAEHVDKNDEDHQVGRPAMDGSDQPSELDLRHDELHAFKSAAGRWPIVHQ